MSQLDPKLANLLLKQHYQLVGKQIAVKKCRWTHNMLVYDRPCYKGFYGIQAHRCIQSTPNLICNHNCVFCWRVQEKDIGIESHFKVYKEDPESLENKNKKFFDSPDEVIEGLLYGWKRIISGYGSQAIEGTISNDKYKESLDPKHITFSLAGEPLIYPYMPELVQKLLERELTVFIVTNGTQPEAIKQFIEQNVYPTQLYVTIPAPDKNTYVKTCKPEIKDGWEKINQTLESFKKYKGRTVGRLTVAKDINMLDVIGYAKLLEKMQPSFIEIKGVVHVGYSQKRMERDAMPYHDEVITFAKQLVVELKDNYKIVAERKDSKVAILSNNTEPLVIPGLKGQFDNTEKTCL